MFHYKDLPRNVGTSSVTRFKFFSDIWPSLSRVEMQKVPTQPHPIPVAIPTPQKSYKITLKATKCINEREKYHVKKFN